MADHPNAEAARASIEAMMKGDMDGMAAGIADDAVWHVPGSHPFAGDFAGKAAIVGRFRVMAEAGVTFKVDEIHDVLANDEHVAAMVTVTLQAPSGSNTQTSVWIFHVRDGKATEFWARNEDQAALDALIPS
jgi:uncharacterized protein